VTLSFLTAAFLTILIEVLAAIIMGNKKADFLLLVIAINLITNPILNLIIF